MFTKFTKCPHCNKETEVTFDILEEGSFEGYENTCSNCNVEFTFVVLAKTET